MKKSGKVGKWDKNIWVAGGNHKETLYYVFPTKVGKSGKKSGKVGKWETKFDAPEQELEIFKVVGSKFHCLEHHFFIAATTSHAF